MNTRMQALTQVAPMPFFTSAPKGLLQRKCTCGTHTMGGGQCAECQKKHANGKPLQAKLAISDPGDVYEQEADRVAEQVMRMPVGPVDRDAPYTSSVPLMQRRVNGSGTAGIGTAPQIVHDVLNSPGQPLDAATRAFFEPRFGHDFSKVRVHADPKAVESAQAVNALAYTVGHHLIFGTRHLYSESTEGRKLLAHELAHVVQQGNSKLGVSESIYPPRAMGTGKSMGLRDLSVQPQIGPTLFLQRKLLVDSPTNLIPNPTGNGVVQTNADTVQDFIHQLCSEGTTAVRDREVTNSYCDEMWPPWYKKTSCQCVCKLIKSKHEWTIVIDDSKGPVTDPASQNDTFQKTIGSVASPSVQLGSGSGGVVRIPSPNSRSAWGTFLESGQLEITKLWLVLGHELCGHALKMSEGNVNPEEKARGMGGHQETIDIENELRKEHGLDRRAEFLGPFCGESFSVPKAKVQAAQDIKPEDIEPSKPTTTDKGYMDLCYEWRRERGKCDKSESKWDCLSKTVED